MKCEKCGGEINSFLVNTFIDDGSDRYENIQLVECEQDAIYIDTTRNWTGYELTEEEMPETIKCPLCKQFPFKSTEIQVYEIVRVVCFKEV
jgi:hypothetical protein